MMGKNASFEQWKEQQMQDPEFREMAERLEPDCRSCGG